jgi:hypothetical protein
MRTVHLILGDSAAGALRQVFAKAREDTVVALPDSFSCGPLPSATSPNEWANIRHAFWEQLWSGIGVPEAEGDEQPVPEDALPDFERLQDAERISVWLGSGLDDQLLLPWLAWVLPLGGISLDLLEVIQFPDLPRVKSLAALTALQLRHHPAPYRLTPLARGVLDQAWRALTASTPVELCTFLRQRPEPSPLRNALVRLARWYPQVDTGLGQWDYRLLANTGREGPRASHVVGHTLGSADEADPIGDLWLYWRLRRLAAGRHPLVILEGDEHQWGGLVASLTQAGKEVLSRAANAVHLNGIDDWVAGVHLDSSAGTVWFARGDQIIC